MEVNRRAITPQEVNTDLKITRLDRQRLLTQVQELLNKLQSTPKDELNDEELQTEFEYLHSNLPILFQAIIDDPTLPFDLIQTQINTAFLIGMKQINPMQATMYVAHQINDRYIPRPDE